MKPQLTSSVIIAFFAVSPCLLASSQTLAPGTYGDDEWQANRKFNMNTRSFWAVVDEPKTTNGQCSQKVSFGGQNVLDAVILDCSNIPVVFADSEEMIVGSRLYTDTPGTVIIVTPNHKCIKRTYFLDQRSKMKSRKQVLSPTECLKVRRNMKESLIDIGKELGGEKHPLWHKYLEKLDKEFADLDKSGKTGSNTNFNSQTVSRATVGGFTKLESSPYIQEDGNRVKKITLEGAGIKDEFVVLADENTGVSMNDDMTLIGNFIYNKVPGQLVVFSGPGCFLKDYSGGDPTPRPLTGHQCQAVQGEIAAVKGNAGYIHGILSDSRFSAAPRTAVPTPQIGNSFGGYSIWTSGPYTSANGELVKMINLKVPGAATAESFEIPVTESTGLTTINKKTYIGNRFYSDTPGTLVVLNGDQCLLKTYSASGPPTTEDITASEKCQTIRSEMKRLRGGMKSGIVTNNNNNYSNNNYNNNNNNNNNNHILNNSNNNNSNNQRLPNNQILQSNQAIQNSQRPHTNQRPQTTRKPQTNQKLQTNQTPQDNQAAQNNQVAHELSDLAESLLDVVNFLSDKYPVNGKPNPILSGLGNALSNVLARLNPNGNGSSRHPDINFY